MAVTCVFNVGMKDKEVMNMPCKICGTERHLIHGESGEFCELHFYNTEEYKKMSERAKQNFLMRMMSYPINR